MAKVFILAKKTDSNETIYADAINFGTLSFLINQGEFIDFYNFDEALSWLKRTILKEFNQAEDYILLSGNVMINCLAISLMTRQFNTIQILLFDGRNNKYTPRILTKQHFVINKKEA